MVTTEVPRPSMNMKIVDEEGKMTREAQRFFIQLWDRTGGSTDTVGGSLQASNNLDDLDDASEAVSNLGFVSPILDKRSPGAIGAISPSTGAFTTVTATTVNGGTISASVRVNLPNYTVATLPAVGVAGGLIYVTDETGGPTPAHSDGANWLRTSDNTIVS